MVSGGYNDGYDEVEYKCDMSIWSSKLCRKKPESMLEMKVASNNFFAEIDFDTLLFLYTQLVELLVASNQRLNLYFRLAGTNKGQQISHIFARKYESFMSFHLSMVENKEKMEYLIDYYYNFVTEKILLAQDEGERPELPVLRNRTQNQQDNVNPGAGNNGGGKEDDESQGLHTDEDENESLKSFSFGSESGIGRGIKQKPHISVQFLDEGAGGKKQKDPKAIVSAINNFQRMKTAQI